MALGLSPFLRAARPACPDGWSSSPPQVWSLRALLSQAMKASWAPETLWAREATLGRAAPPHWSRPSRPWEGSLLLLQDRPLEHGRSSVSSCRSFPVALWDEEADRQGIRWASHLRKSGSRLLASQMIPGLSEASSLPPPPPTPEIPLRDSLRGCQFKVQTRAGDRGVITHPCFLSLPHREQNRKGGVCVCKERSGQAGTPSEKAW